MDLKQEIEREGEPTLDPWQNLREQMDLAKKRPKRLDTVEIAFQKGSRGEPHYVLGNPSAGTYLKLDPRDFFPWELMEANTVKRFLTLGLVDAGRPSDGGSGKVYPVLKLVLDGR
ncbi:hypothetical protein ACFLS0_07565 [Candidatus Bipolaricaulota bacterium]